LGFAFCEQPGSAPTEKKVMRCPSLLAFCVCFPTPAWGASDQTEATVWMRGVQLLYFAGDSGRREFAATVGLNLPWELWLAQRTAPPTPEAPDRGHEAPERTVTDAAPSVPKTEAERAAPLVPVRRARSPASSTRLTPSLLRETLTHVYRAQGVDDAESRLKSLDARSRWSAALPELRLRAARATDESERLAPTVSDPYRYTRDGGTDVAFEVRVTWRLSGLLFNASEVSVERIRLQRAQRRAELHREVLKLLFTWQRARLVLEAPDAIEEERSEAALTKLEAELTLNVLTGGWFDEARATVPRARRELVDRE
jgi:hypothetical protein